MATRFKLQPDPTFRKKVELPVPGGSTAPVEFVFKYRDRTELKAFLDGPERSDTDAILEMCAGWDLADAFNRESVDVLVRNFIPAPALIWEAYLGELTRTREKN